MTGGLKFKEITHNAALCDVATTVLDAVSYTHLTLPTKRIV